MLKKTYEKPSVETRGTVRELTRGGNNGFGYDGVEWWKPRRNASNDYF